MWQYNAIHCLSWKVATPEMRGLNVSSLNKTKTLRVLGTADVGSDDLSSNSVFYHRALLRERGGLEVVASKEGRYV